MVRSGGLYRDAVTFQTEMVGEAISHPRSLRREARLLRHDDRIQIHQSPALPPETFRHLSEESYARRTVELRVVWRIPVSQLAPAGRTTQRIDNGVGEKVG